MEIRMPGHKARREKIIRLWMAIAELVNQGIPVAEVAKRFTNPKTQKPYTRANIYYILSEVRKMKEASNA